MRLIHVPLVVVVAAKFNLALFAISSLVFDTVLWVLGEGRVSKL